MRRVMTFSPPCAASLTARSASGALSKGKHLYATQKNLLQSTHINPLGAHIMRDTILGFILALAIAAGIVAGLMDWFGILFI